MPGLEHVALKASNLDRTRAFYAALGAELSPHAGGERLFVTFGSGTRLIFDQVDSPPDVSAVTYLGLELDSFAEVDALVTDLTGQAEIRRDMREEHRHATGPYGFFVADPDGYLIKVFKYHTADEA